MALLELGNDFVDIACAAFEVGLSCAESVVDPDISSKTFSKIREAVVHSGAAPSSIELDDDELGCFEDCFITGAEANEDLSGYHFDIVMSAITAARACTTGNRF